jgi:Short-chain dehydrogenases of various substrate specificities
MVILITGISSGFGLEMARRLKADGHVVYGTVRRDVEHLSGVNYLHADVRNEQDASAAVASVIAAEGRIDVLVCNAGMGIGGPAEFSSEQEITLQMDTNFMGQVRFIKAVLPHMRAAGKGRIICFSSLGGRMGLPLQSYYCASKYAVEGFCEGLRMEVKGSGIDVVVIEPGDFATGFTAARIKSEATEEAVAAYPFMKKTMDRLEGEENSGLTPDYLAARISKIVACRRPRCRYIVSNGEQRLSVFLKAIMPDSWYSAMMRKYYSCN